ncbi:sensor histidine kinase [Pseudomonas sp. NPDC098747]|uniref:sensor histidine kinase n=1 Tax=Pseudomonas sp. NPDC098747 TaxID=3364487 RepID=UPI00383A59AC
MNENDSEKNRETANAARELLLLGKKIAQARALLVSLEHDLTVVRSELSDGRQAEDLIEANQQLVLALLGEQESNAAQTLAFPDQCQETLEANEQLVLAAFDAQELQSRAEQALAEQKSVLAKVAHELRNPLTPISMIAERMVNMPSEELPRMRALIEGQVQHLSRIVDDLLDVSRVSSGKLRINRVDLDITQIIDAAVEACRSMMVAKNLNLRTTFPSEMVMMKGDPVRLTQVMHNLLSNAVKYTPNDGDIELFVILGADALTIRVCDNGIGIDPKTLPFVFDPYVRDARAIGFCGAGLGIGLTVVRELVEAHGGKITGHSAGVGQGSEFVVTLPIDHHLLPAS